MHYSEPKEELMQAFKAAYKDSPDNLQYALATLKAIDRNPLEAMKVVMAKLNIGLAEAKFMVMDSEAWNPK